MTPFVVVPMLNEVSGIAATCRSLGFGAEAGASSAVLVLVDNGSSDGTVETAKGIRASCGEDRVSIVHENCRGYVPARVAGIQAVSARAASLQLPLDRVLVLQADADTVYEPGYVDAMVGAASAEGRGALLEGASIPPRPDEDPCRLFRELEAWVDEGIPKVADELDVVVDDKVAGYLLADYEAWGGHEREFYGGDELFAETTRLLIHARLRSGARRLRVENAFATTSSRRIIEDPALAFATAGFPREQSWVRHWRSRYSGPRSLAEFSIDNRARLADAISVRRRHVDALFRFLPALVASSSGASVDVRERSSQADPASLGKEDRRSTTSAGRMLVEALLCGPPLRR